MYFMDARDSRRLRLPKEVEGDLGVEIFILECRSLRDLPEISKRLKRPVNLATAVFARALGVRCSNTLIRISERGDEVHVHEGK